MNELKFMISSLFSAALVICSAVYLIKNTGSNQKRNRRISPLNVFIAGVFAAIFVIFLPVYLVGYYSEENTVVISVLLSLHNTMRVFILDGEFDTVRNALSGCSEGVKAWFSLYSALLYVLAPALTAGFVLSMFKSAKAEARYRIFKNRPTFIFSKLNEKSIALAKSIYDNDKIKNPVIVFAEVYEKTREDHYEWVSDAKEIGAILMPKDIDDISIDNKKGRLELFYISDDESENVTQAVKFVTGHYKKKTKKVDGKRVAKKYNERKNTKVFVFAASEGNARIIDSLDKGNHYEGIADERFENEAFLDDSELFKVRRVDDIQLFAWDCIEKANIFDKYVQIGDEKVISALILGMGNYGMELLKTLVWYGQMKGYRLEINVVDKKHKDGSTAKSRFGHACPDIIKTNNKKVDGDSFYSIEFYENMDIFTDSWDEAVGYDGDESELKLRAERLRRTTIAFVAFGDDDKNIQAAVELRTMFDRVNGTVALKNQPIDELPAIYSIVYDEKKTENIAGSKDGTVRSLVTYNGQPYNIQFIGSLSSQYNYSSIYPEELEKEAFDKCHMQWSYYSIDRKIEEKEAKENRKLTDAEKQALRAAARKEQIRFYEDFEYFRLSSMSKAMHKKLIREKFSDEFGCENGAGYECDCEKCWARRANEHNRWNAYTRSIGYVGRGIKSNRAKTHTDLIPFNELSDATKRLD